MYSVLIVDDEDPVIESISFMLGKFRPELRIAGTAKSGREAIEKASEVKPDIVLIDVRMPGIDGLEAIREIRQRNPAVLSILTTAYERFDIAQTAFDLGVHDYILKPFSRDKLISAVDSAVQRLSRKPTADREGLKYIEILENLAPALETLFFRSVLLGADVEPFREIFIHTEGIDISRGCIAGVLGPREGSAEKIIGIVKFKYQCIGGTLGGQLLFFFPASGDRSGAPEEEKLLAVLDAGGIETNGVRFVCGEVKSLSELRLSYAALQRSGIGLDVSTAAQVGKTSGDGGLSASGGSGRLDLANRLLSAFRKKDRDSFFSALESYISELAMPAGAAAVAALMATVERDTGIETSFPERSGCASTDEVLGRCFAWGESLFGRVEDYYREEVPEVLKKAFEFIDTSYDKPIQLSDVAEVLRITPSYLSRLFSRYGSTSFVDYLTRVRMERAKELLKSGRLSIKEVSSRVGYQDPNYFSRIFKKTSGEAPSEFS